MEQDWQARVAAWRARGAMIRDQPRWTALSEFKAGITGRKGEGAVARELARHGVPALHDVVLEDKHGTAQIDHLVLGCRSIAVLETKTYAGRITGAIDALEWTQHLRNGEQCYSMLNPLLQNDRHLQVVAAQFQSPMPLLSRHVVSAGTAEFEGALMAAVVPLSRLMDLVDASPAVASRPSELWAAWEALRIVAACGEALRQMHERRVQQRCQRSRRR